MARRGALVVLVLQHRSEEAHQRQPLVSCGMCRIRLQGAGDPEPTNLLARARPAVSLAIEPEAAIQITHQGDGRPWVNLLACHPYPWPPTSP